MVDAVVTVFLEKLLNALTEESLIISEFKHEFKKLENELQLMQSFLKDAERMKRKNKTLRTIMACLRDLIYESEDILSDCEIRSSSSSKTNGGECRLFISPSEITFRYQTGKRLREINSKIINIKTNISSYLGVPLLLVQSNSSTTPTDMENSNMNRWSSHLYDHTRVVGLEEETKKIKDWLLLSSGGGGEGGGDDHHHHHHHESSPIAIGVVGMGGVGKTTTAQKVFNDREIEDYFERKIWVSVSQTFSDEQIMRSMLRSLGDSSVGDDSSELLRKINQYLQGKRYLIVMDDVWREDDSWWRQIYEGLPKGNSSSSTGNSFIIITTRIEKVARRMGVTEEWTHRPKLLSEADSWLLFRRIAFAASGGECVYPELVSVGMEIVEKCKGLPLTIKAVGGMMLCKLPYFNEWKRIVGNFRDELAENDNQVMASLQLSYDELPSYLKSCFLCFSLYPEDCVITKEQLIHWWIGEGFVPVRNGRLATEAAEDCFSGLMNRCLIDVVDKNHNGKIYTCKMHDMVRDLVIRLAEECAFSSSNGKNSRHLGLKNDMESQSHRNNLKLRALLSTTKTGEVNKVNSSIAKEFCKYKYLRVLDISKSIFEEHLTSLLERIGSLQHLTYLCFSSTHPLIQVPHSVERLINLQILDVSYCQNLKTLPSYIPNMEKLIVLDISHCGSLEYLPKGLGRLSKLQALIGFKPARPNQADGCRLSELKSMTQLRTLELRLTRSDEIGDDETNVLLHLQQLQFLTINCFDSHEGELVTKLDQLCPPQQLHDLCLKFFPGEISPTWLNPRSLPMLRYLSISSGNLAKMNQRFWGNENMVWKVEGLMLDSISDLQEEWVTVQRAMPLLRVVSSCWCPQLESFPIEEIGFRGGVWKKEDKGREVKEIHQ